MPLGARAVAAPREAPTPLRGVPYRAQEYEDETAEIDAILRFNDNRDKSFMQKMGEAEAIRAVEKKKAQERKERGKGSEDLGQNFAQGSGRNPKSRDYVADRM